MSGLCGTIVPCSSLVPRSPNFASLSKHKPPPPPHPINLYHLYYLPIAHRTYHTYHSNHKKLLVAVMNL